MYKINILILLLSTLAITACQVISPIFVNYNGVRRDVAQWINHQQFMSMQQKRTLAQLSRAQQQIKRYPDIIRLNDWPLPKKIRLHSIVHVCM